MNLKEKYNKTVVPELKNKLGYKNALAVPRLLKVTVNIGTGRIRDNKQAIENITKQLPLITGQKLSARPARKSIAGFKTREGVIIGYASVLRGKRMYEFVERFIGSAVPRIRDFRGFETKWIDNTGNFSIGVKEHTVFPEMAEVDVKNIFGFQVIFTTSAKTKEEALEFFRLMGFPFKK